MDEKMYFDDIGKQYEHINSYDSFNRADIHQFVANVVIKNKSFSETLVDV